MVFQSLCRYEIYINIQKKLIIVTFLDCQRDAKSS